MPTKPPRSVLLAQAGTMRALFPGQAPRCGFKTRVGGKVQTSEKSSLVTGRWKLALFWDGV